MVLSSWGSAEQHTSPEEAQNVAAELAYLFLLKSWAMRIPRLARSPLVIVSHEGGMVRMWRTLPKLTDEKQVRHSI